MSRFIDCERFPLAHAFETARAIWDSSGVEWSKDQLRKAYDIIYDVDNLPRATLKVAQCTAARIHTDAIDLMEATGVVL